MRKIIFRFPEIFVESKRKRFGPRRNFPEKVAHPCLVSLKHVIVNIHLQDLKFTNQEKLQYGRRAVIVNSSHVQYIKVLTWPQGFRDKIANFSRLHCLAMPRRDLSREKNNPHIESEGFMLEYIERGLFIPMRFYNVENYKKLLLFRENSIINHFFILPLLNKRMFCWKKFNPASWLPQRAICCLFCYRFRLSSSQTSRPIVALYCLLW